MSVKLRCYWYTVAHRSLKRSVGQGYSCHLRAVGSKGISFQYFPTVTDIYTPEDSHIELADTAGAEELDRLRPFSYDKADAFIIAFSIDNRASLENVEEKVRVVALRRA